MENLRSVASEYRQSKKRKKFSKDEVWRKGYEEFQSGNLHSGKGGKVVKDKKQFQAIMFSKIRRGKW
ncbi:MAG: hypothetical protein IMZ53_14645 [Thermoplasmata archaeon]|nr:hypothetical protein [Thermoplasmata archaeon]